MDKASDSLVPDGMRSTIIRPSRVETVLVTARFPQKAHIAAKATVVGYSYEESKITSDGKLWDERTTMVSVLQRMHKLRAVCPFICAVKSTMTPSNY